MKSNLIEEKEMIFCPLCPGKKIMKQITYKHLKKHSLSINEFKEQFPNFFLIHPNLEEKIKNLRIEGKKKKENAFVEKQCWNFELCKNVVTVNINVGNKNTTCEECRSKNLFHPSLLKNKERLSKQAKKMNKDQEIINKRIESLINRTPEEKEETKKKRETTFVEKDGENWKEIQHEKTKAGMLRNHGVEYALQDKDIRKQAQQTYYINTDEKYKNPMEDPKNVKIVFEKRNQEEITEKTIETNIKVWGGPSPLCHPTIKDKARKTQFLNQEERVLKYLSEIGFEIIGSYESAHQKTIFKHVGGCGYEWETNWNLLSNSAKVGIPCPNCKPKNTNKKITQNKIQKFIEGLGFKPLVDNRVFLGDRRELDFIINEEKVAIEYCGLYYHSDEMLKNTRKKINDPKTYHLTKLEICESKDYRLISIFEDEWVEKKEIVKSRLKQILNRSDSVRVHARECKIYEITTKTKTEFLNNFHLQGSRDNSFLSYGAFDKNDNIVAIMTFGNPRSLKNRSEKSWEIKRFCSDYNFHCPGIAGKLLKYFKNNNDWQYIVSYADRRWSNGNLYEKLGFKLENKGFVAPWYIDVNKVKRYHRSIVWKSENDKKTGLTQEQLAVIKGYKIIYDCGNLKYVLTK